LPLLLLLLLTDITNRVELSCSVGFYRKQRSISEFVQANPSLLKESAIPRSFQHGF
jgi:hypothetical protein